MNDTASIHSPTGIGDYPVDEPNLVNLSLIDTDNEDHEYSVTNDADNIGDPFITPTDHRQIHTMYYASPIVDISDYFDDTIIEYDQEDTDTPVTQEEIDRPTDGHGISQFHPNAAEYVDNLADHEHITAYQVRMATQTMRDIPPLQQLHVIPIDIQDTWDADNQFFMNEEDLVDAPLRNDLLIPLDTPNVWHNQIPHLTYRSKDGNDYGYCSEHKRPWPGFDQCILPRKSQQCTATTRSKQREQPPSTQAAPVSVTSPKDEILDLEHELLHDTFALTHGENIHSGEQKMKPSKTNWELIRPMLGFAPINVLKETMHRTTQFAQNILERTPMRRHLKTRFPAANIPRRNEPVATDTVYSDTPAIDNGACYAQIFIGRESLVADVYSMISDKEFVNTLEDQIRRRGAMDHLISDHAQVEISKRVHDILRAYI